MNQEQIKKVEKSIQNMKDKKSKIYLLVQDTKGNAKASIAYSYRLGVTLSKQGYNMIMLHEKSDYTGVSEWLGSEYMELPHQSIEGQNLEVSPEDFIIVPELYGFVMSQITKLPCGKIVLCQSYDHMLETLQPGQTWAQLGFYKCITTSETQKEYISNVMRKPMIAIHTREQRDTANIIKNFYIKFPQYRWITFRDMRRLTEKQFADALQDCFLSVWVDETSSFGTFPLESMKSNVPVLGLVPNLAPSWMNEDNGLWINNKNQIVDFVADFLQNWLEDNVNEKMYESMLITVNESSTKTDFEKNVISLFDGFLQTRLNSFEEQLNKLTPTE